MHTVHPESSSWGVLVYTLRASDDIIMPIRVTIERWRYVFSPARLIRRFLTSAPYTQIINCLSLGGFDGNGSIRAYIYVVVS